jgi:hypothetical protein
MPAFIASLPGKASGLGLSFSASLPYAITDPVAVMPPIHAPR